MTKKALLLTLCTIALLLPLISATHIYHNYPSLSGVSYAQNTNSYTSGYQPFGHNYYYKPFNLDSHGTYHSPYAGRNYRQPTYATHSYQSVKYPGNAGYRIEQRYNSPYVTGGYYREKIYNDQGYLVQATYHNSLNVRGRSYY